ncbi:MAG: scyllo-inositol 2-dehydrogenase [Frankiaceae bacterium]|jgi:predicted dehydrogenase|nr:scyllo-inositol 2-dehydrogenase [Frankiaceae bacterium]
MSRLAVVTALRSPDLAAAVGDLTAYLARCGLAVDPSMSTDADVVLVWADERLADDVVAGLLARAAGGVPVLLAGPTLEANLDHGALVDAAGVVAGRGTPTHECRLRPGPQAGEVAHRLDGDLVVTDRWLELDKTRDDVDVLMTAMTGLTAHAVLTWRPATRVGFCTTATAAATVRDPAVQRLVHRWVRRALGVADGPPVRVGILGYGAIGHEHSAAIASVEGLVLAGVCDKSAERVAAARAFAPGVTAYDDGDALLASPDVDLVVVSTPPNTHAEWALRALGAGKHVVVEKPFCLTTAEADEMTGAAARAGRSITVYQNRRWDADYLTVKRLVRSGAIGDVFHYESFVGGYGHPCNFWHSDEEVSGGAVYDWGSHFLDWILDLLPAPVAYVTAAAHKRRWHDVTNADHSRVTIAFADGVEAEFVHSDLAAAMKPKWYVLGTDGAIVGHWRHERVVSRSAIGTLVEDPLAASESPARITLHAADGSVTDVAVRPAPRVPFHRELADQLLSGAPMSVTAAGSRRNISVMEAATLSARDGGRPVTPL